MRIERLHIKGYGNSQSFEISPDKDEKTTVMLGRNGAGKSKLIEAIVEIFRDLEAKSSSAFYYELSYSIRGFLVDVINNPNGRPKLTIKLDNKKSSAKNFFDQADKYLPKYVFSYYSGWNRRLEQLFDKPTKKLYDEWKNAYSVNNMPLRRLFYCRKDYSQLVLLAFFLMDENVQIKKFLNDFLNIKEFESALFVMHKPFWRHSGKPTTNDLEYGDSVFWYARGAFQNFADRLWRHAIAPIRNEEIVTKDFRDRTEDQERLYLYIKDKETLRELMYPGENETHFFANLEGLYLCDLLDEVRVTVEHKSAGNIRFDQLSEGEQQLLTVLGLLHFTKGEESLFLLDEPDTHLNPAWTYEYLDLLEEQVLDQTSQLLIATHNPLMIGGLKKEQVRLLQREQLDNDSVVRAHPPSEDPIGMGVDGLLQSEVFGLRSVLPVSVVERLTKRYKLLGIRNKTEEMATELKRLTDELDKLGIATTFPHPYFDHFAKALASNPIMEKKQYTPEELDEIEALSKELLDEAMKTSGNEE